jgi:hypothetical protein
MFLCFRQHNRLVIDFIEILNAVVYTSDGKIKITNVRTSGIIETK